MIASFSISAGFKAKFELVLVFTLGNAFSSRFNFIANRKSVNSSKKKHWGFLKLFSQNWSTFSVESTKIKNATFS